MTRPGRTLAAALLATLIATAACTEVRAAEPFPEVPETTTPHVSHLWAYVSLIGGAGLVGSSFLISHRADATYREYLATTDPATIERLYDRTVTYDRLASGTLLTGEVLVAVGVYLRFIRPPAARRMSLDLSPRACALSLRF